MDNVDIYGDLQDVQASNAALLQEIDALKERVQTLEREKDTLLKQNEILTKNISCLYRTAVMEVQRKEDEISLLRDKTEGSKRSEPSHHERERYPPNSTKPREKPKEHSASERKEEIQTESDKRDSRSKESGKIEYKEKRVVQSDRMGSRDRDDSQYNKDYRQRGSDNKYEKPR